jgi:hypothetical protein
MTLSCPKCGGPREKSWGLADAFWCVVLACAIAEVISLMAKGIEWCLR